MTSFQWGNPPADLGVLPRMALSFFHTYAGPWLTQKQPTCRAATPLLPSPDAPWKWYPLASECLHTHLSTFEKIPFTALKYNLHERLRGWSCKDCVISVRYFLSSISFNQSESTLEPMHLKLHVSPPELMTALSREGRESPNMTLYHSVPAHKYLFH